VSGAFRKVGAVAGVAAAAIAMVCVRVAWSGAREHERGLAGLGARDEDAAIEHLSRSARWYLPGSGRVRQALDELLALGRRAEASGDVEVALAAYREVRRCVRAVRSLWIPNADLQPVADERIAHLMAGQSPRNRAGEEVGFEARKAEHLALLSRDDAPRPGWSLLVVLAFFGWGGAAFGLVWRAWDAEGGFHPARALGWAGGVVACLAVWIVAMAMA